MDMTDKLNKNTGLIVLMGFIAFLIAFSSLIIWVGSAKADIVDIKKIENQQVIILQLISDSLKDKTRDHEDFKTTNDNINTALIKISKAIIKLEGTLNRLELRIELMNPKPLYQQLPKE